MELFKNFAPKQTKRNSSTFKRCALVSLPFILYLVGVIIFCLWAFTALVVKSDVFILFVNRSKSAYTTTTPQLNDTDTSVQDSNSGNFYIPDDFPRIYYNELWTTITIDSIGVKNVPVYSGVAREILRKGVGHAVNSRYPGQNGNIVMSAHVASYFKKLEQVQLGDLVVLETKYGTYVYEVVNTYIFEYTDQSIFNITDGHEQLSLYTCYPSYQPAKFKTQRFAVICELVSGKKWVGD